MAKGDWLALRACPLWLSPAAEMAACGERGRTENSVQL